MLVVSRQARSARAQAMVEMVLSFPILLVGLVGIMYMGKLFFTQQVVAHAAQEGARFAAKIPNLHDPAVRDMVRGFDSNGAYTNYYSVVAGVLGSANLLSFGDCGDLPPGAAVKILPWDADGSYEDYTPPGTISVRIVYPMSLLINPFVGVPAGDVTSVRLPVAPLSAAQGDPPCVSFPDLLISQNATVSPEVFQEDY